MEKKDYKYLLIIAALFIAVLYFAKTKENVKDDFTIYKEEAEKRISTIQDSLIVEQLRFDSMIQNMDSLTKIDKSKKDNYKYIFIRGKEVKDSVVVLLTDSASLEFLSDRLYQERVH